MDPVGYALSGDPDDTLDHATTQPLLVAPGDTYVNVDFGFEPLGFSSSVGDTVYFDADADGLQDLIYSVAGAHAGTMDGGSIYLLRNVGTKTAPGRLWVPGLSLTNMAL